MIGLVHKLLWKVKQKIRKRKENRIYKAVYYGENRLMYKERCARCEVLVYNDDYCDNCGNPMSYIN